MLALSPDTHLHLRSVLKPLLPILNTPTMFDIWEYAARRWEKPETVALIERTGQYLFWDGQTVRTLTPAERDQFRVGWTLPEELPELCPLRILGKKERERRLLEATDNGERRRKWHETNRALNVLRTSPHLEMGHDRFLRVRAGSVLTSMGT